MQVIGGWAQRGSLFVTGTPYAILEWKTSAGTSYIAYGTSTKLYVETSSTLYDITPSGFASTTGWSFATYGDTLIANATGGKIYQWNLNTGVTAAQVTNAPVAATCILVTPERQLLALGCNEEGSGTFNGRCIRGSDLEDITDWTTTATNNAFEHILDGAASLIVTARRVGSFVAVWTQTELWQGQFIGDPSQTYRFDRAGTNCGAVSLRGVTVANDTAFWMDNDIQFHNWAPGAAPAEIACPVIQYVRSVLDTSTKATAVHSCHIAKYDEIWFTFGNTGTYLGRFVALSMASGLWFKGLAERRAMHQGLSNVIAALNNGNLVTCETGQKGVGGSTTYLDWSLTSGSYYLSKAQQRLMMRGVWPDFGSQAGDITITLTTQEYPQDNSAVTQAALTVTNTTKKKNFRASGRLIKVTIAGNDTTGTTNSYMRFGSLVFDAQPTGMR
jgi:hypothetical protein